MAPYGTIRRHLVLCCLAGISLLVSSCGYLQLNPPPDVKADPVTEGRVAWLAASSNMLAAAGYGYGSDVQARADNIYKQLIEHYGKKHEGWTDVALQWWINSPNNEWPENPYKRVTVIGSKKSSLPWTDPLGSIKIANYLRDGVLVSAGLSWPVPGNATASAGGHVLNCWGDDRGEKKLNHLLPSHLRVTDCYRNKGGIIQTYKYDNFSQNSANGSSMQGWSVNYDKTHPFIQNLFLLSKVTDPEAGNMALDSRLIISLNNGMNVNAAMIRINFFHSRPVLSFQGTLVSPEDKVLEARENIPLNQADQFSCTWVPGKNDFSGGSHLTMVLQASGDWDMWSGIAGGSVRDNRGEDSCCIPNVFFHIEGLPLSSRYHSSSATGGYYLFALAFSCPDSLGDSKNKDFEALILQQYLADINPERPSLDISAPAGYQLKTVKAGHSYGYLDVGQQQEFSNWMVNKAVDHQFSGDTLHLPVNLIGLLPFPKGEVYSDRPQ